MLSLSDLFYQILAPYFILLFKSLTVIMLSCYHDLFHQVLAPYFVLYKSLTDHPEVWTDFEPR